MSTGHNNKFLMAFSAFVGLGAVALGVLLFLAHKQYSAISVTYDEKEGELQRLQALKPYPDANNLAELEKARDAFKSSILTLQTELASKAVPLEPITPNQFQDRLRAMLAEVTKLAETNGVQLEENFYLGFEQYKEVPPSPTAAPELYRQLKRIDSLVRDILNARVTSLAIKRSTIPEEAAQSAPDATDKNAPVKATVEQVLDRDILRVRFESEGGVFRQVINTIVSSEQFLIIRTLTIQNEKLEGPARQSVESSGETPPPVGVADLLAPEGEVAPAKRMEFIVGKEKISADLLLEMIDFKSPATEPIKQSAAK